MCGIAGIFGASPLGTVGTLARRLSASIAHRGPDGEGALALFPHPSRAVPFGIGSEPAEVERCVGVFVHRRLAIIDLVSGHQPMGDAVGIHWITFNGEIYNYRELRAELTASGSPPFRTTSDTEVILEVYRRWGVDGFARLNGMFAFAIFDGERGEIVLARDPLGVKPLYWGRTSRGAVWFASELKAASAIGALPNSISDDALLRYLVFRFVPAPDTLLAGVRKLVPGVALRFAVDGALRDELFFAPPPGPTRRRPDAAALLTSAFGSAVERQMIADVPIGAFLSGGLDSSLIVQAMSGRGNRVRTYAVGFPDAPAAPSELRAAAFAADEMHTIHRGLVVSSDDCFDALPQTILSVEEPAVAQSGAHLLMRLSASARADVKVVLTGQGADEPLGGYSRHHAARLALLLAPLFAGLARRISFSALGRHRTSAERFRELVAAGNGAQQMAAVFGNMSPSAGAALVRHRHADPSATVLAPLDAWWRRSHDMDPMARVLYIDARTSLSDDLLVVGDKTSMAHSLEVRVPFLDLDYLRLAESLHGAQRVQLFRSRKWLQQAVAARLLPPRLARSLAGSSSPLRRKRGFDVPVAAWLRARPEARLLDFLTGRGACLPDLLSGDGVQMLLVRFVNSSDPSYRSVLALFVLEVWLRANLRGDSAAQISGALNPGN